MSDAVRRLPAVALTAATLLLAGCPGSESDVTGTASAPPDQTGPYDAEELAVYREAVRRLAELEARERNRTKAARPPVVLSTRAISVKSFQDNAAEVVLERCIDRPDVARTRNGVRRPAAHDEPVVQEVVVVRYENRTWRIGPFTTTDRPCEG